jgi:spore maturation protein CgeB
LETLGLRGIGSVRGHRFPKLHDPLLARVEAPLWGVQMLEAMTAAQVVLNNHIDASGEYAANMRLFEATGVGACLLTDRKRNLRELFEAGSEILDYSSPQECLEKARWVMENPKEGEKIALAGQKRCLRDHTYADRATRLHEIIRSLLKL